MSSHIYGNFVRLLMYNTNKNTTTKKQDLKNSYGLDNKKIADLINFTKLNINSLGLELIGIEKNKLVDPLISEKYAIRRILNSEDKENIILGDNRVILVYSLILLEGGRVSLSRLVYLCRKINAFKNDSVEDYLQFLKRDKFINIFKHENEMEVELGYRYFIEYDEYNILDILE